MKSEEIQQEVLKILFALKEMNSSFTIMANNWQNDRPLNPTMLQTFVEELHQLLKKTISFSSPNKTTADEPIFQCKQQSIKSSYSQQQQTKQSRPHRIKTQLETNQQHTQIDILELINLNLQLSEENQELTKRLEEAGERVLYLQDQISNKQQLLYRIKEEGSLSWQNKKLRIQLDKAQKLLTVNNQEFIEQIQKYNERLWKMQRQIQSYKCKTIEHKGMLEQKDFLISKLKLKNMQLQMNSRIRVRSQSRPPTERIRRDIPKSIEVKEVRFSRNKA